MPPETNAGSAGSRLAALVLPITIVGAILVLLVPLPAAVLDLLLAANVTLAVLVLLTVLSIRTPQQFSAFPTILVTTTLTRLVLNVAVTRRVLTYGGQLGLDAAGEVIRAFGEFVAGDQVVVGAILFAILVIIQFVVITKGATRISEVAARFMLDGLPGRQMAIDADLHAGSIDQQEARRRRDDLYRQADFFGAMDGAGKFVRGDAIAGVLITFVNILAGLYLGLFRDGMSLAEAVDVFTKLTIGDGLVSQVPAFLIALAAGLIVTRSSAESHLGRDVTTQLLGRSEVLLVAAGFLFLLSFSGLPRLPLLALSAALGIGGYLRAGRAEPADPLEAPRHASSGSLATAAAAAAAPTSASSLAVPATGLLHRGGPAIPPPHQAPGAGESAADRVEDWLAVDPLELETGYRLIAISDPARGDLLERVRQIRQRLARELGLIVPPVRVRDDLGLGPHEYRIKLRGAAVARGLAYAGRLLAIPPAGLVARPDGREGVDPVSGQPAVWIHADGREVAEAAGCRILDAAAVVTGHFAEVVLDHADELLTHEQIRQRLDPLRKTAPGLVDDLIPGQIKVGTLRRVLQNLVRERVSIRDLEAILEALAEHAGSIRDPDALTEEVRAALGRRIVQPYLGPDGRLRAAVWPEGADPQAPGVVLAVADAVAPLLEQHAPAVLIAPPELRSRLKDRTRFDLPRLAVLSRREIPRDVALIEVSLVAPTELVPAIDPTGRLART